MIVVLDTNVVASATYWRGKPAHCLEAWAQRRFDLAISHSILAEYEDVIARLAARYPKLQPTDWLSAIKQAGHLFLPAPLPPSTADPDDEMFIECAVAARADYLVTGDRAHLLASQQRPHPQGVGISPSRRPARESRLRVAAEVPAVNHSPRSQSAIIPIALASRIFSSAKRGMRSLRLP